MTIKIIYALLILLMSLAGCSGDKVSRQPTAKLSSGSEGNLLLSRNNTPSDPLRVCSPAADLHTTDDEEEDREETARRAREAEARRQHDLIVDHIKQIYGPDSTSTIQEQLEDLKNYCYNKLCLFHIMWQLKKAGKAKSVLYELVEDKMEEMAVHRDGV